jgi:hypothetical protein
MEIAVRNLVLAMAVAAAGIFGTSARADSLIGSMPLNGMWQGGIFNDDQTHAFSYCAASAPYRSGITMYVVINRGYGWGLAFQSAGWNLEKNQQIPLALSFDGHSPWNGTARATNAHMAIIPMATNSELISWFRAAYQMRIYANGQTFIFNLDGTSRLMAQLSDCVATQLAIERSNPPRPPQPVAPDARYDDLNKRFLELGLCSACADNVTQYYMKQPNSQCATLARSALEGNSSALQTLRDAPPYCTWHY